jgi:hypothetical protein
MNGAGAGGFGWEAVGRQDRILALSGFAAVGSGTATVAIGRTVTGDEKDVETLKS